MDQELKSHLGERFKSVATKADLEGLKADLAEVKTDFQEFRSFVIDNIATQDDLKNLSTKEDLKRFATKADFESVKADLADLKESQPTKDDFNRLMNSVDGLIKLHKDNSQETTVMGSRVGRIEDWVQKAAPQVGIEYKP